MSFSPMSQVRVLDFTWNVAGPTATKVLAELGAEVIKVEWPMRTDPGRRFTFSPVQEGVVDSSGFFADLNVGKKSLTINTKSSGGKDIVDELIRNSDVLIESFSPGVMASWGWTYERMKELNPNLIYLSLSGFGHTGPYGEYVAYGPTAQAASGVTHSSGEPGRPPAGWGFSYLDVMAGYQASWAIVAALHRQRAGGGGQRIDLSQIETGASMLGVLILDQLSNRTPLQDTDFPPGSRSQWPHSEADGFRAERGAPYNLYPTKDAGHDAFCAITVLNEDQWNSLTRAMGSPAWTQHEDFADAERRIDNQDELDALVAEWTRNYGKYELMDLLQAIGVPAGALQSGRDRLESDPSLAARGVFQRRTHPVVGEHRFTSIPFRVDGSPVEIADRWPLLGQDTYAILGGVLGLSEAEISSLETEGTLWPVGDKPDHAPTGPSESTTTQPPVERRRRYAASVGSRAVADLPPLHGVRVLEVDDGVAQYAGKLLVDLGAEVIKVEPLTGSSARHARPFDKNVPGVERSLFFSYYNAGKKSVTLDLDSDEGRLELARLAATCDVVLDGLSPSRSDELGLAAVAAQGDGTVHVAVSRFGRTGPWRNHVGSDLVSLALGGVAGQTGYDAVGDEPAQPIAPTGGQSVHFACVIAATATVASLGEPPARRVREIDVSVHDCIAMSTEIPLSLWEFGQTEVRRHTGRHSAAHPHTPEWQHRCADGHYVCALPLYLTDPRFQTITEWFDETSFEHDLRNLKYATQKLRDENLHSLVAEFAKFCAVHDSDYVFHEAQRRSIPWAKVTNVQDLVEDEHLAAREYFARASMPDGTEIPFPKQAWIGMKSIFEGAHPVQIPALGSSNNELLESAGTERETNSSLRLSDK